MHGPPRSSQEIAEKMSVHWNLENVGFGGEAKSGVPGEKPP